MKHISSRLLLLLAASVFPGIAFGHGVDEGTQQFLMDNDGIAIVPFMYIGAKHMVTGYDHLLFLLGVIFFLYRARDVLIYVSFFTLGHSITLLAGVYLDIKVNAYLIDAIIGLSIIYKGFDNLGGFQNWIVSYLDSAGKQRLELIFSMMGEFVSFTKIPISDTAAN